MTKKLSQKLQIYQSINLSIYQLGKVLLLILTLSMFSFFSCKQATGGKSGESVFVTVTFNMMGHGTEVPKTTLNFGTKLTKPTDPTAENWTFDGWYTEPYTNASFNESKALFDFNRVLLQNTTLYAKWTVDPSKENELVTVTVDASDCDGHKTELEIYKVEMLNGEELILPSNDINLSGQDYLSDEWVEKGTSGHYDSSSKKIVNTSGKKVNITLNPKWSKAYTVTFNMMGFGNQIPPVKVKEGEKISKPVTPMINDIEKTKCLEDWYRTEKLYSVFNFDTETITENITLYAYWKNLYTIIFDFNGRGKTPAGASSLQKISDYTYQLKCSDGMSPLSFDLVKGKIADVTEGGKTYEFSAWGYTIPRQGQRPIEVQFNEDELFDRNITLRARWEEKK